MHRPGENHGPLEQGTIILLSGTSSAGKTTPSRALQAVLPEPYFRLGSDDQFALLHPRFLRPGSTEREAVRFPMVRAYYRTLAAFVSGGCNVIADTILIPDWPDVPAMRRVNLECLDVLSRERVYFVGVLCPVDELERRERERGDRGVGSARAQYAVIHAHGCYDFSVDTSRQSPEECASEIASHLTSCPHPGGLQRLVRGMSREGTNG